MKLAPRIPLLLVILASSYLTLGFANADAARDLWWLYGGVTFVLTLFNLRYLRGRALAGPVADVAPPVEVDRKTRTLAQVERLLSAIVAILAGLSIALVCLGGWQTGTTVKLRNTQNDLKTAQADTRAGRIDATWEGCGTQNGRHDASLVKAKAYTPAIASVIRTFVATLAPHQDCRALLRRRFGVTHPSADYKPPPDVPFRP